MGDWRAGRPQGMDNFGGVAIVILASRSWDGGREARAHSITVLRHADRGLTERTDPRQGTVTLEREANCHLVWLTLIQVRVHKLLGYKAI